MAKLLEGTVDPFGSIVTIPKSLPTDPNEFRQRLGFSITTWSEEGRKAVWLEVPIEKSPLIPVAVEAGFNFHHTGEGYLLMARRLMEDAFLPPFATHYVGIGGVVLTPERDLLVVREKYGMRGRRPTFKLPGGTLLEGEHLVDAVEREVLEETGVVAKFEAMACFRQWHGYRYGKSDIYFVARLHPLSKEITMQADEIEECLWLPVDQFMAQDDISHFNKQIVRAAMETDGVVQSFIEGFGGPDSREYFMPPHLVDGVKVVSFPRP